MKKSLAWLALACLLIASLSGCSSNSGGNDSPTGDLPLPAGDPSLVAVTSSPDGASFKIRAEVTDRDGRPANDGTEVSFSVDNAVDSLAPTGSVTSSGIAETSYTPADATAAAVITAATGNGVTGNTTVKIVGAPALLVATHDLAPGTVLSENGDATITAWAEDVNGNPVADGTEVYFRSSAFGSTITPMVVTSNGFARATFNSGTAVGLVTVTASTKTDPKTGTAVEGTVDVLVSTGDAATITFAGVTPVFIGVKSTGQQESAELLFDVFDIGGNPVPDGTEISFRISQPLSGGEKLQTPSAFTTGGRVSAKVISGTVAGTIGVTAEFTDSHGQTITTVGKVAIVSGPPDGEHLTMAVDMHNQAGGVWVGLNNTITAVAADRFGNVVKDGTPISFATDCGRVGLNTVDPNPGEQGVSQAIDAFNTTTLDGTASAQSSTSNPLYNLNSNSFCTYLAYTPGVESFNDINGDGIFQEGTDVCTGDLSEPYIDEPPRNHRYDAGEIYLDANGNGRFDGPDGTCSEGMIWTDIRTVWSHQVGPLNVASNGGFSLKVGESKTYTFDVADIYGMALVSGTEIAVTKTCNEGTLTGVTSLTLPDIFGLGQTYSFTISSDLDAAAAPAICEIEVRITAATSTPDGDVTTNEQGNNGATVFTPISGILNQAATP